MSKENALTTLSGDIYATREAFDLALVDRSINFEREAGFAIQQLAKNDYMMRAAMANRQAVVDAVVNIAAIGISLNPAKKQAYLVPRDNKICLDISYMGLMDLAQATGSVKWAQAALVHEQDSFELVALDKAPVHKFNPFSKDRGPVVGVYVTIKTSHNEYLTHTMTIADALAIRDRSSAWKANKSGPWATDEGEMIKKTCVKQAYKYWPKTDRLESAIHHLNTENGEGVELVEKAANVVPIISGRDAGKEDFNLLTIDRKQIIEAVAESVKQHYENDDIHGAYEEYIGITDSDEKSALWGLLADSKLRSALKAHGKSIMESEKQHAHQH